MNTFDDSISTANILIGDNNYKDALEQYNEAVLLTTIPEQKIDIYNSIGRLNLVLKKTNAALLNFEKSLEIHNTMPVIKADLLKINKATVLNNLGVIVIKKSPKIAIKYHKEALAIFENANESNPDTYTLHLANTHYSYADASYAKGDYYMAKKQYKEAIKVYGSIDDKLNTEPLIANSHYNLGNIYADENNVYDARNNYVKALKLFRKLTETKPKAFRSLVAATFNNLAVTAKTMYNYKDAITYYENSLKEYEILIKDDKKTFLPFYAATLNSIGIIYSEQHEVKDDYDSFGLTGFSGFGTLSTDNSIDNKEKKEGLEKFRTKKAFEFYNKATNVYGELVVEEPELYSHYLATCYHNLGVLFDTNSEFKKAEKNYEKALTIRRNLAKEQPESFNLDVCVTLINIVTMYQNLLEQTIDLGFKTESLKIIDEIETRLKTYKDDSRPIIQGMQSDLKYFKDYFNQISEESLDVFDAIVKENAVIEKINETFDPSKKLQMQKRVINLYLVLKSKYDNNPRLKEVLLNAYIKYSWFALRSNELGIAESAIANGYKIDKNSLNLKANKAHLYLLKNNEEKFNEIYASIKDFNNEDNKPFTAVISEDLTTLQRDGLLKNVDVEKLLRV